MKTGTKIFLGVLVAGVATTGIVGYKKGWFKKGLVVDTTHDDIVERVYQGHGTILPSGMSEILIAYKTKSGKYFEMIQPNCVMAPCPPMPREITKERYETIKQSQLMMQ